MDRNEYLIWRKPQNKNRGRGLAKEIGASLSPDLLGLRTRLLVKDIKSRYRCETSTAMSAIGMARVRVGIEKRGAHV